MRLLIVGASARAAAESATRAGATVTAVDAYADLDQHPSVRAIAASASDGVRVSAADLVRAAGAIDVDAVAYLSPFENHPRSVETLARGRRLLGNGVEVLRRVRDPVAVARALRDRGVDVPQVVAVASPARGTIDGVDVARDRGFVLKPIASGGGHGISRAEAGTPLRSGWYLQEFVDGWPGSVTFVAAGGQSAVLAISRQIVGDAAFGASGYRYCGSLIGVAEDERLRASAQALAAAAVDAFDLVGANGIDFIARDGVALPIEINPRWSSSMELVDRWGTSPVMASHIEACQGSLVPVSRQPGGPAVVGKAVVFARHDVVLPDTRRWLDAGDLRDVSGPGRAIARGQPVCTVLAEGPTTSMCYGALVRRAADVYAALEGG